MSQKTNLNISPYYDDFDKDNNFYKVLFRPGRPVQARELSTLQSILQNQVESFGSHVFKEGSMVIPGGVFFDNSYFSTKVESDHLGLPISLYSTELKGKKLKGQNSGVEILVNDIKFPTDSTDYTDPTLFIKYLTGNSDNEISNLEDGEPLLALEDITYGNTTILSGQSVATLIPSNASAVGSAVKMNAGVYFIRGTFVDVSADTIVLDPYSNQPSYRVGLNVLESIITAKDDSSLYDNAKGFSNFAAPGADRFKITASLAKKGLDDTSDVSFVELIKLREGELKKLQDFSVYNELEKYLAARTYEESGNYSLDNFKINLSDSLDNGLSNGGIFKSNQITEDGNTPSDDLACVEISAGKAYVKGFRISEPGTSIIDFDKPRDTDSVNTALVPFDMGTLIRVNNVSGTPVIGTNIAANTVSLYSRRKTSAVASAPPTGGYEIGKARVYSFGLRNTPYVDNSTQWNLHLFDVQTYTYLTLNTTLTASISSFVRGASSGATGFVNATVTGTEIILSQTSGSFIPGEKIIINELEESTRTITSLRQYTFEDVKSVYQNTNGMTGGITGFVDFSADTVLETARISSLPQVNNCQIGQDTSGVELTSPGNAFTGIKTDSIIQYQLAGSSDITFNRVSDISSDLKTLTLAAETVVAGVNAGSVGVDTTGSISLASPVVVDKENTGLYAKLDRSNVSEVDLANSTLSVSAQTAEFTLSANSTTQAVPSGITSAFYSNFDTQKYSLLYEDGTVEPLTRDQFKLVDASSKVQFSGLSKNSGDAVLNVTVEKQGITNKTKEYIRSNQIVINKTSAGISTTTNGLTKNNFYGLRIEDREISLNVPDVANIIAVLESKDSNDPTLDKITTVSGLSLNTNSVVGEKIIGAESGAVAQIVNRVDDANVEVVYFTNIRFTLGELITFQESNIETTVQLITLGNNVNITERYSLDKGQREQFYDYSRIVRKRNATPPDRRVLVVYDSYEVPATDSGDIFTVNSYAKDRFSNDIPLLGNNVRATDVLDFRPRVSSTVSTTQSPFAFTSRDFSGSGATSSLVVSPEGDSVLGYSYYLPRIDKLVLSSGKDYEGDFAVIKGVSSLTPKAPALNDGAMHLATIELPAYLYNANEAKITLIDNKRYTMRDIGRLEDRIENLEVITSLSLLELDTKTLHVKDITGDRFKSGFFVDDFKDNQRLDLQNQDNTVNVDTINQEMVVPVNLYSVKPQLGVADTIQLFSADFSQNLPLLDSNVQKTGDLITLAYTEVKSDIGNPQASRIENVNPYEVVVRIGQVLLDPSQDNWTRDVEIDGGTFTRVGDNAGTVVDTVQTGSVPIEFIRSRNVGFSAYSLTPGVRHYPFFEGRSGIDIIPKLLEIDMISGTFDIGETVIGNQGMMGADGEQLISFRTAQPNHKTGAYNAPTSVFPSNPYDTSLTLGTTYTESSTVLNIDIASLVEDAQGSFFGRVEDVMRLVGETSGAIAIVSQVRLIPDSHGALYGSFFFRDPTVSPPPPLRFTNGLNTFRLTSDVNNATALPGDEASITSGDANYSTSGTITQFTTTTTITRLPPPPPPQRDPLAQSFTVDETGMFLSSLDLYFAEKDDQIPVTIQVRNVVLGTPTGEIVNDFAQVILDPTVLDTDNTSIIKTSADASLATRVTFPSPVYLEPNREYAIVILAPATIKYKVWIAQMSEETIETQTLGVDQGSKNIVQKQYLGGSLFKSQNGTIWTATQTQDLKFSLYKCSFTTTPGSLTLFNSELSTNDKINFRLQDNALKTYPRKLKVGIDTTAALDGDIYAGIKVTASNVGPAYNTSQDAKGFVEKIGSPITTTSLDLSSVTGVGTGYDSTNSPYSDVPLYSITGDGSGATATVTVNSSGGVTAVSIAATGNGYAVGDLLGITTANVGDAGAGAEVTVATTFGMDTLFLTNVQGEKFNNGRKLAYYTDVSAGTISATTGNVPVRGDSTVNGDLYTGNILEVSNYNHSMKSTDNVVQLDNISPDTIPQLLTADLSATDTTISVASTTPFATFEGISTTTGYVKIGQEIIFYDGISSGNLSIGTRGISNTPIDNHSLNDRAFKYEFNGVSLTGINTTHSMPTNATLQSLKTTDSYFLEIARGAGRPNLLDRSTGINQISFTNEKFGGGNIAVGSQNFQYDAFIPAINTFTPSTATTISSQLRSVSGTSEGGSEISFVDQGYESVEFNELNQLSTPRLLCSKVDENAKLTSLPRNRSVTLLTRFETTDTNLSPVLDLMNGSFRFVRNRLNNPVSDYTTDSRSNRISGDPHAACYISQKVDLKQASTGLKVLIAAYRDSTADFRVLYRLFKTDSSEVEQSYELFPGYDNLQDVGIDKIIVDPKLNSGRPDTFVPASVENEFREYEFTIDNLDEFVGFQIKIVISGTNEATPPRFKDLRAIALA
tara:strand:+ start:19075 stop:26259 length:7185 start_codon:yes stop_codon:yes gene_type:complete